MSRSAAKEYFKREFSKDALRLEHNNHKHFFVSCWQQGTSAFPLLILRTILFGSALSIWTASFVDFEVSKAMWFIYLTHWGLTLLLITTGVGFSVSAVAYFKKPTDHSLGLTWHDRLYWVLYNMCVPVAFLITVFYWTVLYTHPDESMEDYEDEKVEYNLPLDVAIHGINSLIILLELLTASQPSRFLHVYQPLGFSMAYALFGIIYHLAGGVNRTGEPWVYAVINWSSPGWTLLYMLGTGVLLVLLHAAVVGVAYCRDTLARRLVPEHTAPDVAAEGGYQWRQRDTAAGEHA